MAGSDLAPPLQELLDAANGGDRPRFLALFTEDRVVDDWGRTPAVASAGASPG